MPERNKTYPDMATYTADESAFIQLKQLVAELSGTASESDDIVVVLLPDDFPAREVRYAYGKLMFLGFPDESGRYYTVVKRSGQEFEAVIDTPASGSSRRITEFLNQSGSCEARK